MSEIKVLIIILLISAISFIVIYQRNDVLYIKSNIDNQDYLVQNTEEKQSSANMLARIKQHIMSLVNYIDKHKNDKYIKYKDNIDMLSKKIKYTIFSENSKNSSYTSYSVNKGDEIVFCLKSKETNLYHDINLIMYVAIHELAHIANPEYGHGTSFKIVFAFLAQASIDANIYDKINFKEYPKEYCGMMITESII